MIRQPDHDSRPSTGEVVDHIPCLRHRQIAAAEKGNTGSARAQLGKTRAFAS
jgi:hypothetical protein